MISPVGIKYDPTHMEGLQNITTPANSGKLQKLLYTL